MLGSRRRRGRLGSWLLGLNDGYEAFFVEGYVQGMNVRAFRLRRQKDGMLALLWIDLSFPVFVFLLYANGSLPLMTKAE